MKNILIIVFIILFLSSCLTINNKFVSKEKYQINAKSKAYINAASFTIFNDEKGKIIAEFKSEFVPSTIFRGDCEFINDNIAFTINNINFLSSWANGWTLGENLATGKIIFEKQGNIYKAKIIEKPEILELKKGEIRYFDDYYRFEKGFTKTKDKIDRITEIVKFIKSQKEKLKLPEYFGSFWLKTTYSESFDTMLKKYLLDKNTDYPVNLKPLLESKTIERDLEETEEVFVMFYNFDYFFDNLLKNLQFEKL
ncbi:MAG: hypothetical protein A2Y34_14610 [Spirochaetes bacterium GWC1_27_15]|nr:MAG: hypothetical protein A2Y34_14610 [Spirochaetes bacterium GWC1_27_15]